jgi:hypothetical protein
MIIEIDLDERSTSNFVIVRIVEFRDSRKVPWAELEVSSGHPWIPFRKLSLLMDVGLTF